MFLYASISVSFLFLFLYHRSLQVPTYLDKSCLPLFYLAKMQLWWLWDLISELFVFWWIINLGPIKLSIRDISDNSSEKCRTRIFVKCRAFFRRDDDCFDFSTIIVSSFWICVSFDVSVSFISSAYISQVCIFIVPREAKRTR